MPAGVFTAPQRPQVLSFHHRLPCCIVGKLLISKHFVSLTLCFRTSKSKRSKLDCFWNYGDSKGYHDPVWLSLSILTDGEECALSARGLCH